MQFRVTISEIYKRLKLYRTFEFWLLWNTRHKTLTLSATGRYNPTKLLLLEGNPLDS